MPHVMVQVSTEHNAPDMLETNHSGVRVVKGPHAVLWSDGHRE